MRKREEIERDGKRWGISQGDTYLLEVLLDIRDLLLKNNPPKKRGRPRKNANL